VPGAALHCDQLDALRLVVVEHDGRSIECIRGTHFDAVEELVHSACCPGELVSGSGTGSCGRALHHKVVWWVLHSLCRHGAGRRAVH